MTGPRRSTGRPRTRRRTPGATGPAPDLTPNHHGNRQEQQA
ncbi:hypothetical protein ACH4F3_26910 [Streptomyces anulatus]